MQCGRKPERAPPPEGHKFPHFSGEIFFSFLVVIDWAMRNAQISSLWALTFLLFLGVTI